MPLLINLYIIIYIQVSHSQKLSSPPLMPWVGVDYNGTVLCAHCNCMAGVGEACSHIAALLYFVRTKANLNKQTSCTSKLCTWLQPSHKNEVH